MNFDFERRRQFYERILNQILRLDPEVTECLAPIEHSVLRLHAPRPLDVCWKNHYLHILGGETAEPHVEVWFSWLDLWRFSQRSQAISSKSPKGIKVQGDIAVLQLWEQCFKRIDLDWELKLSEYIGEPLTYGISRVLKQLREAISHSARVLPQQSTAYLQEELAWLPPPVWVSQHQENIEQLRNDVARLRVRLQQLEGNLKT